MTALPDITNNDLTVAIIGGGPAGSSCAIKLKKLSAQKGLNTRVILYEGKVFKKKNYYNQCLGVLSPPLDRIMQNDLEVPFPHHIVRRRIEGYHLHTDKNELRLSGEHDPSYACRRVEFDDYLFQITEELGVETIHARVTEIDFGPDGVMVFSEGTNVKADVVVGAFGLDDGLAKIFERQTAYRQPNFLYSVVTKIHPGPEEMERFGNYIHAFLLSSLPKLEFGAITPKGNHLSTNIAGVSVDANMLDRFLQHPVVRKVLPANFEKIYPGLFYFKGKFPTLPAKGFYGDRYVMIGDAAGLNRPFKGKGVNSAVITGTRAAHVILDYGLSREDFKHYMKACEDLTCDMPYGKVLRTTTLACSRLGFLDSVCETAKSEPKLKKAFFNIVSGQETYKKTWEQTRSLRLIIKIAFNGLKSKFVRT